MMKLERIVPGSRLTGVSGDREVEILSTRAYGPDAVEVTWRGPEGRLGERILFRDEEPRLRAASSVAVSPSTATGASSASPRRRFASASRISSIRTSP